jgi:hypothetical protein
VSSFQEWQYAITFSGEPDPILDWLDEHRRLVSWSLQALPFQWSFLASLVQPESLF